MNKIVVGLIAVVVLIGGAYVAMSSSKQAKMEEKMMAEEKAMMEKEAMEMEQKAMMEKEAMEKEAMMKKEEGMMDKDESMMKDDAMEGDAMMKKEDQAMEGDAMMKKAGTYAAYDASKLAMAASGDVVLFFKASWCPSCKALDADIKANASSIKEGLTILEVDYDSQTALRQKYGVTSQHTLVQVDKDGNQIAKWSGSPTLASLTTKVQ